MLKPNERIVSALLDGGRLLLVGSQGSIIAGLRTTTDTFEFQKIGDAAAGLIDTWAEME